MPRDPLAVALRPRSDWEAADLGLELARAWRRSIAPAWALAYLVPAVTLVLLLPSPLAAVLVAWWLRPCAERALLDVLARRTFGRPAPLREVLAAIRLLPRAPGPWLASLTSRRFSPVRAIWLAVWHLEGLRGAEARARVAVLTRERQGVALWCALLGGLATVLLALSLFAVGVALLPDATGSDLGEWISGRAPLPGAQVRLWGVLFLLADALCAPWVTAAVFGLYISRRTELEAWDIEQVFRGLTRRVASLAVFLIVLAGASTRLAADQSGSPLPQSVPVTAADNAGNQPRNVPGSGSDAPPASFDPQATMQAILAEPEFGREETVQQWRFRQRPWRAATRPPAWLTWLVTVVPGLATALRWAMWALAGGLVTWLAIVTVRARTRRPATAADATRSVDVDEARVPLGGIGDALAHAQAAVARGALVEALGLLYTGALRACADRGVLELHPGDTEADCLGRVSGRLPVEAEGTLRDIVRTWQAAAYARRPPAVDRVRAMCDAYARHFEGGVR